jgi:hypothetical protein
MLRAARYSKRQPPPDRRPKGRPKPAWAGQPDASRHAQILQFDSLRLFDGPIFPATLSAGGKKRVRRFMASRPLAMRKTHNAVLARAQHLQHETHWLCIIIGPVYGTKDGCSTPHWARTAWDATGKMILSRAGRCRIAARTRIWRLKHRRGRIRSGCLHSAAVSE